MLRDETEKHGIVLIFDEVMTSRLSPGGLHQLVGITPDLISFGKYLGGGVTFGAFGGRTDLMARLDPRQPDALVHSGTYNNNVLTMAAGIAGLSKVFTPDITERLNQTGDDFRQHLQSVADQHDAPFQIMGRGSMICIHPQREPIKTFADTAASSPAARKLVHLEMHLRGFYLARRGFMSLSLPLTESDLNSFAEAFEAVVIEHGQVLAAH
jgi:glutamate-1-semialdehyde 2,1-aminomutase